MNRLQQLVDEIGQWSDTTFGDVSNGFSKVKHLEKEVFELADAIRYSTENSPADVDLRYEFADCFMLLFDAAKKCNFTVDDIMDAMREKLEINRKRKWGDPNEHGVVEHIRTV